MIAMLAASATNPKLLDPVRERLKAVREQLLEEGPNGIASLPSGLECSGSCSGGTSAF